MVKKRLISRRSFLRLALVSGIAGGLVVLNKITQPIGPVTFTRWMLRSRYQQWIGKTAFVALGRCDGYDQDILGNLRNLWVLADMPDVKGKKILIKPNLVDVIEGHPGTTHPQVVGALIDLLMEKGAASITVGDGPAFRRDAYPLVESTGLADELAIRGIPFIDLNYDDPQPVPVKDGWFLNNPVIWLPRHVREADLIISVPKLKTHHWSGVSLSVKNLLGVVPGSRYGWPKNMLHINGLTASILGVYQVLPQVISVVDGIVGMEGDGPLFGTPVEHGLLAAGQDPVAVDVVCAQAMGFTIEEVEHLAMAAWAGVGQTERIDIQGDVFSGLKKEYKKPPKS